MKKTANMLNLPDIYTESRKGIEKIAKRPFPSRTALVSITDTDKKCVKLNNKPAYFLEVKVDDIISGNRDKIVNFTTSLIHENKIDHLIYQCESGDLWSVITANALSLNFKQYNKQATMKESQNMPNIFNIKTASRKRIEEIAKMPFLVRTALISIVDIDKDFVKLNNQPDYLLQMKLGFDINEEEAKKLVVEIDNFAKSFLFEKKIDLLICQCENGNSMSVVIAGMISNYFLENVFLGKECALKNIEALEKQPYNVFARLEKQTSL